VAGTLAGLTVSAVGAEYTDVAADDWYYSAVSAWSGVGILRGYGDGRFGPDDAMRAADLDIVLARLLGGDEPDWRDSAPVSREASAKALTLALGLEPVTEPEALYADDAAIGEQFRAYVYALRGSGVQQGLPGNEYNPKGTFTRAELIQSAYNAISAITDGDVLGETYEKTLVVRRPDVTIKDSAIKGDLIVGHGVGDGDLTLDNVSVDGRVVVYGGGSHSIVVKNGSKIAALVAGKPNVHIQLENGAVVQSIEIVEDNVQITVSRGATVETLIIDAGGAEVEGGGMLTRVTVKPEAVGAVVTTPNTIIVNDSRDYVTTANGVVRAGSTQTTPTTPTPGGSGGYPGAPYTPPSTDPGSDEPQIVDVEVDTAEELVQLIKDGTESVRIVVNQDIIVTTEEVGKYMQLENVYDLLFQSNTGSSLYIPENVTLTIGNDLIFRIGGNAELAVDGTLILASYMWIGGFLTVGETGVLTTQAMPGSIHPGLDFSKWATVRGDAACIAKIIEWFAQEAKNPKPYGFHISFELNDSDIWEQGNLGALTAYDLTGLLAAIEAINTGAANPNGLRITHSFEITENANIDTPIWVIEDEVVLTISGTFTVNGTLNVAGEIIGTEGGKVIIPASSQINNVVWYGGWIGEELGTGVLHDLPTDVDEGYERTYVWQGSAWVLEEAQ
jgi:hypothetical protein